ncbi:camp-dependent protein kinase catalytic subunit [Blyttiomyces sp. JEL0837]|nr:camp-dependent protein kinase catalytic subunit [Blyttiomyces sp. JEL0837]
MATASPLSTFSDHESLPQLDNSIPMGGSLMSGRHTPAQLDQLPSLLPVHTPTSGPPGGSLRRASRQLDPDVFRRVTSQLADAISEEAAAASLEEPSRADERRVSVQFAPKDEVMEISAPPRGRRMSHDLKSPGKLFNEYQPTDELTAEEAAEVRDRLNEQPETFSTRLQYRAGRPGKVITMDMFKARHRASQGALTSLRMAVNRDIPVQFNLSRMLSTQLLEELITARGQHRAKQKHKNYLREVKRRKNSLGLSILSEGSTYWNANDRQPQKHTANMYYIPPESRGIALGMPRQDFAPPPWKEFCRVKRPQSKSTLGSEVEDKVMPLPPPRTALTPMPPPTTSSSTSHLNTQKPGTTRTASAVSLTLTHHRSQPKTPVTPASKTKQLSMAQPTRRQSAVNQLIKQIDFLPHHYTTATAIPLPGRKASLMTPNKTDTGMTSLENISMQTPIQRTPEMKSPIGAARRRSSIIIDGPVKAVVDGATFRRLSADNTVLEEGEIAFSMDRRRSAILSGPQLGKTFKRLSISEEGIRRASTVRKSAATPRSDPGEAERNYTINDFIFIRKARCLVSNHNWIPVYQVTLACVPAVRRRSYAMRVIQKRKLHNFEIIESVQREKQIHESLGNRFCLQLLASLSDPKNLFMVLEWAPSSLDKLMGLHRVLTEDQTRFYLAEVTVGLEYLHSCEITHRGITPRNLLVDGTGHIKISDFSSSVQLGSDGFVDDTNNVKITRYTAPEILLGEKHTRTVDWFSVGTIMYEVLTGIVPFGMGTCLDTLAAAGANQKRRDGDHVPQKPAKAKDKDKGTHGGHHKKTTGKKADQAHQSYHLNFRDTLTGGSLLQLPYQYRNISEIHNLSRPAEDLVRRLMELDAHHRITSLRGTLDVKAHPWFRHMGLTWKDVEEGKLAPPFAPGLDEDEQRLADTIRDHAIAQHNLASSTLIGGGGGASNGNGVNAGGGAGVGVGNGGAASFSGSMIGGWHGLADDEEEEEQGYEGGRRSVHDEAEVIRKLGTTFDDW